MSHNTTIGKEIVEMLMFSLYPEPRTIYREYIQNAYDSIREAVETELLSSLNDGIVYININKSDRSITIKDNGTGISEHNAEQRLKDIGNSIKRLMARPRAGWYGVGRLVGAGYCQKLTFRTTYAGETSVSELVYDVNEIRRILQNNDIDCQAGEVIDRSTTFSISSNTECEDSHWFEVTLSGVLPQYSSLLDHNTIKSYIVQVAPLSYDMMFKRLVKKCEAEEDKNLFLNTDYIRINLNDETDLKKQYSDIIEGTGDKIHSLCVFRLNDPDKGTPLAWGWYALTRFTKQIEDTEKSALTRGLRLRVQNIQIGDGNYFGGKNFFKEARGNEFFNGEVHIITDNIHPTTDRSDLEPTEQALLLKELLREFFSTQLQPIYKNANEAKKAIEHYVAARDEYDKVTEKPITESFTEEVKEEKLAEQTRKKQDANSKFATLKNRQGKDETPEGVKKVIELYIKEAETGNIDIVNVTPAPKDTSSPKEEVVTDSLEDKILKLSPKLSAKQISVVKKIFKIMNKLYGKKQADLIRSIQHSIVNGLLN